MPSVYLPALCQALNLSVTVTAASRCTRPLSSESSPPAGQTDMTGKHNDLVLNQEAKVIKGAAIKHYRDEECVEISVTGRSHLV